jgi:hypothetical protein
MDEKSLYDAADDDRPVPRRGHPLRLLLYAFLIGAGWLAWQMHLRAVARAANPSPSAAPAGISAIFTGAAPAPAPDPEARPAPEPPAPAADLRRFYGLVYDIATKKPLSGAKVIFEVGEPGAAAETPPCSADLNGHYVCDVSEGASSILVYVSTEGYQGQFEDLIPPLRARSESERRAVLAQRDSYLEPARVLFEAGQEIVPLDLVVVPKAWLPPGQRRP